MIKENQKDEEVVVIGELIRKKPKLKNSSTPTKRVTRSQVTKLAIKEITAEGTSSTRPDKKKKKPQSLEKGKEKVVSAEFIDRKVVSFQDSPLQESGDKTVEDHQGQEEPSLPQSSPGR